MGNVRIIILHYPEYNITNNIIRKLIIDKGKHMGI